MLADRHFRALLFVYGAARTTKLLTGTDMFLTEDLLNAEAAKRGFKDWADANMNFDRTPDRALLVDDTPGVIIDDTPFLPIPDLCGKCGGGVAPEDGFYRCQRPGCGASYGPTETEVDE